MSNNEPVLNVTQTRKTFNVLQVDITGRRKLLQDRLDEIHSENNRTYVSMLNEAENDSTEIEIIDSVTKQLNEEKMTEEKEAARLNKLPEPEFIITNFKYVTSRELVTLIGRNVVLTSINEDTQIWQEWIGVVQGAYKIDTGNEDSRVQIIFYQTDSSGNAPLKISFYYNLHHNGFLEVY